MTGGPASAAFVLLVAGAVHGAGGRAAAARRLAAGGPSPGGRRGAPVPRWRRGDDARRADPTTALGTAVTAVAAELRAGRAPGDAWRAVLDVPVLPGGIPLHADVVAAVLRGSGVRRLGARRVGPPDADLLRRVRAVLAATRLAVEVGAPLAPVLDGCARSLVADAEAETALRAALAGPRQTTALLTALPLLGVVLGTALGADPLGVLLGGGLGSAAGVVGVVLTLAGRAWVGRLVARTRAVGSGRRRSGAGRHAGDGGPGDRPGRGGGGARG